MIAERTPIVNATRVPPLRDVEDNGPCGDMRGST